jgi:hypothetical protein
MMLDRMPAQERARRRCLVLFGRSDCVELDVGILGESTNVVAAADVAAVRLVYEGTAVK